MEKLSGMVQPPPTARIIRESVAGDFQTIKSLYYNGLVLVQKIRGCIGFEAFGKHSVEFRLISNEAVDAFPDYA